MNLTKAWVSERGCNGCPSSRADDVVVVGQPHPERSSLSACRSRCWRRFLPRSGGRATERPLPLLVSFSRTPLSVCSVLRLPPECPRSRSTARQRRATISPRRSPQRTPSRIGMNSCCPAPPRSARPSGRCRGSTFARARPWAGGRHRRDCGRAAAIAAPAVAPDAARDACGAPCAGIDPPARPGGRW